MTRTTGLLLAILAGGCGTASTQTSSSAVHTATPTPPAAIPAGFARYQAQGFSFLAPGGLKPARTGGLSGLPRGASVQILTAGGRPLERTNTQIIEGVNPSVRFDIDRVATNLRAADSNNPSLKNVHTSVRAVTVAGAQAARIVSESYVTRRPTATAFRRTWLMVSPKPGTLIDLVVVVEPGHGGTLDPSTVLRSFRLGG
jgi:N-acetylmuramoyl-L-alanine amidase